MSPGFDRPLYILPFDHRGSWEAELFGWPDPMNITQMTMVEAAKQIAYDGFKAAIAAGVPREKAAILVDELYGSKILRLAANDGFMTACPAEKSGWAEFEFEYGENFAEHSEDFKPTFYKVLVRYNPEGDRAVNRRQSDRLRRLSDYLRENNSTHFMLELLVPPEKAQLEKVHDDELDYDIETAPTSTVRAIEELQGAHVEPDIWKVEGLDRRDDCERIVAVARWRPRQGQLPCPGPRRRLREDPRMADRCGRSPGLYRLRRWPQRLSKTPGRVARERRQPRGRSRNNREPLPRIRANIRERSQGIIRRPPQLPPAYLRDDLVAEPANVVEHLLTLTHEARDHVGGAEVGEALVVIGGARGYVHDMNFEIGSIQGSASFAM